MSLLHFIFLRPPAAMSMVGWVLFALLLWFGGPMLSVAGYVPLGAVVTRVVLILLVPMIALVLKHRRWRHNQAANLRLVENLLAAPNHSASAQARDHRTVLSREAAFEYLAFGGDPQLARKKPWFWVLGGHTCGKSAVIRNSAMVLNHYAGSGVTREYGWWTNVTDAPLLEIPISQVCESAISTENIDQDHEARLLRDVVQGSDWRKFLDAVARGRPEQPVNGLLLVISLAALQQTDQQALAKRAAMLRARLADLQDRLSAQIPCYLVLTKADSIPGFAEFFSGLSADEQQQVWGVTFGLPRRRNGLLHSPSRAEVDAELALLANTLDQHRLRRLASEQVLARRFAVFGFPAQFAAITGRVAEFVQELTREDGAEPAVTLRGLYFCSALTRVDERTTASFFIPGIFNQIILREAGLARSQRPASRLRRRLLTWFYPLLLTALLCITATLSLDYHLIRQHTSGALTELQAFQTRIRKFTQSTARGDEMDLAAALDALRAVNHRIATPPFPIGHIGLYETQTIKNAAQRAYRRALNEYLLPYIQDLMEARLRARWMAPVALRKLLDLYLMLEDPQTIQVTAITAWLNRNLMTGQRAQEVPNPLTGHAIEMFKHRRFAIEIDHDLVSQVRQRLATAAE